MSSPKMGDIYWINLHPPFGTEIRKPRPCVIISPDADQDRTVTVGEIWA